MTYKSKNEIFSISIPENWKFREGKFIEIYQEEGVGAITISSYYIDEKVYNFIIEEEIIEFIESIMKKEINDDIKNNIIKQEKSRSYCHFYRFDVYWRVWVSFINGRSAFITYNCNKGSEEVEKNEVDQIVDSLRME